MGNESKSEGVISPDELEEDDGNPPTPPYGGSVPRPASYNSAGSMGSGGSAGSYSLGSGGSRRTRTDALVGQTLDGRFKIQRLVARGGMGRIYEAEQMPLGRRVALKVMDLTYAEELDPDFQKRFFLEASTCAQLSHPNTIRVFDYGNADEETFYIVMEFVPGRTLLKTINESAPLAPLRVIHVARQICGSLAEAHGQGVIHRDLKPSNVLLTEHGDSKDFVKVLDFGLVKLIREGEAEITKSGLFLGSPNYMSPEQIRSNKVDQRSDIYSLGVLLFMCLTGRAPFKRDTSVKVLLAQLEDEPPAFSEVLAPNQVCDSLEWIVRTCLAKKADERFASVDELNRALRAVEMEILGHTEGPMQLTIDDKGRVQIPDGLDLATASLRWSDTQPRPGTGPIKTVASAGSLVGERVRPADASPKPTPKEGSRPRKSRSRVQRPPPTTAEVLMASPWFAALLGASALGLLILLVFLLRGVLSAPDNPVVQPTEPPAEAPADVELPEDGPVFAAPSEPAPTPRTTARTAPAATPRPRSTPAPSNTQPQTRATSSPSDSTDRPPSGENESRRERDASKPDPTPEPKRARTGSDLRDPWAD
jgi:serine/threonine protein kinase